MTNTFNDKQYTILCHVDYLKMSQINSGIVSRVPDDIDVEYGKIAKMTIMWGKIHKYLRDEHRLLLARQSDILHGWIDWKDALWYPRRYERIIINTSSTPTFWYSVKCDQTIPNQCRPFSSFCDADIVTVKSSTSRHTVGSIIIVNYSDRSWYWWL